MGKYKVTSTNAAKKGRYKVTFLTSIGAGLEYYDFVIYAMLASYLSTLFFADSDPVSALLKTFAVFAIGYVVRPIGGMLFGSRSDRLGRKKNFIVALFLMATSTLAIGLLPTYHQIGVSAAVLLIICRAIQGLAYGAEMPGAITFLTEHCDEKRRGFHCGLMFLAVATGSFIALLLITLLTTFLSSEQMYSFGWRIPFILGSLLGICGAILRRKVEETPLFKQTTPVSTPLRFLLQNHFKQLLTGIGITVFAACFILFYLYIPAYLHQFFQYPLKSVYRASTIALLWGALLLPLFGWLSDYIGRSRQLLIGSCLILFGGYGLFSLASLHSFAGLLSFTLLYQTAAVWLAACYPSMLAELFPTQVRYSGVAICYNTAYAIAGLTPMVASYVIKLSGKPLSVSLLLSSLAVITIVTTLLNRDRTGELLK